MNSNMSSDRIREIESMSKLLDSIVQSSHKNSSNNWDIWTEETSNEPKDPNKWYYVIDDNGATRYKGEWVGGLSNGQGVKEIFGDSKIDHSIIEGTFVDGMIHGKGKQTYDKNIDDDEKFNPYYEGEFKEGHQNGFGAYYYGNGCYRKGNLVEGKFQGFGIYYNKWTNQTWVGKFVDDEREEGEWNDGELKM